MNIKRYMYSVTEVFSLEGMPLEERTELKKQLEKFLSETMDKKDGIIYYGYNDYDGEIFLEQQNPDDEDVLVKQFFGKNFNNITLSDGNKKMEDFINKNMDYYNKNLKLKKLPEVYIDIYCNHNDQSKL